MPYRHRHPHHLLRDAVGFLLVSVVGPADAQLGLDEQCLFGVVVVLGLAAGAAAATGTARLELQERQATRNRG